jgi:hypothetical protein
MHRIRRAALAALLLLNAGPEWARAAENEAPAAEHEAWFVISIGGRPVGSIHERTLREAEGVVVESSFQLALNRLGSKVEMAYSAASREAPDGGLRSLDYELKLSQQTTSMHAEVEAGVVRLRDRVGAGSFERTLPFSGQLAGPERLRRLSAAQLRNPDDRLALQIFSAELSQVATLERRVLGSETLSTPDGPRSTLRVEESLSGLPVKRTIWLDGEGRIVRSADPGPFGTMITARAERAAAELAAAGGELPAEVYASSLVRTQVRLPSARKLERLTLELRHRRPELGWPDLAGPGQRVIDRSADSLTLEVVRRHPAGLHPFPIAPASGAAKTAEAPEIAERSELLEANAYIQSDDPELRATALRIVAGETDALRAGLALQRWVSENLTFDLGVVMAPSVEVFRNRRGTCAAYATLLTAMLRAVGIPARYVLGYVYLDGMLGGHAWSEILLGEHWIALDAAVPADGPADAGHVALLHTSLRDGVGALNYGAGLQLFGQIDGRILSFQVAGERSRNVEDQEQPYAVAGNRYRNAGLGLEVVKPADFRFADLDGVWPSPTLLSLVGPKGEKVTLESLRIRPGTATSAQLEAGLAASISGGTRGKLALSGALAEAETVSSPKRSAAVWTVGSDGWILRAEGTAGNDAGALLRRAAQWLRWDVRK